MFGKLKKPHRPQFGGLEILKYIGPGLLVTVGFIDPGNWASNVAAGAQFGYTLLWMVTLSTIMLIVLQHNVAHLGIVTGLCLSEACMKHLRPWRAKAVLGSAVLASISTALAELLGAGIGLNMLFPKIPLLLCVFFSLAVVLWMLLSNSYRRIEKYIIGFVSLIGISFIFELTLVHVPWTEAVVGWVVPRFPHGSIPIIMSVMGAVVMPHNLFLHSEIIQSRQWNLESEDVIKKQLSYEFLDTLFSMLAGWAINSAMIIMAAATFFVHKTPVNDLQEAENILRPLLGDSAAIVFAVALLLAGIASSVTAGMAGGSIYAGIFGEPYDIKDSHSRWGVVITLVGAVLVICGLELFSTDLFMGLIVSQILLSVQIPWTIFAQISLTSSKKVMGPFANGPFTRTCLWTIGAIVAILNVMLLWSLFS